jgi:hypothetical protein
MRGAALVLCLAAAVSLPVFAPPLAAAETPEFVQAVEFPYYLYPKTQWERELVWLKTLGVRTVSFSIPWNWHQLQPGDFDFTGHTSPRRDLAGFLRVLRKLDLQAWVRPLPPVANWADEGWPPSPDAAAQSVWLDRLAGLLASQTTKHGGPIAFVEGGSLALDAPPPPSPETVVSATDPAALERSRAALETAHGALRWVDVEDALYPDGWQPPSAPLLRKGAVDLNGNERPAAAALSRDAALLRSWGPLLEGLHAAPPPKSATGTLPRGLNAVELTSPSLSAVSVVNRMKTAFQDDLAVFDPASRRFMVIPSVSVPAGESLWLPLNVALGPNGLCRECSAFSTSERIIYATAELLAVEFENGILAMEFAAPAAGEVILQLAHEPVGPLLAAGKPAQFDWDPRLFRARLPIPKGSGAASRVRIGLGIEAPETSAFFSDAKRLIIGQKNLISTAYSSPEVASRSRLRVPEGFSAEPMEKSPGEVDYTVSVPPDALHGDWAPFALEADGVALGRARLQLFRPVSIRLSRALALHFGPDTALAVDPPVVPVDARAGGNLELVIRNNSPRIQNYRLEAAGDSLEFSPAQTEIAIGAVEERTVSLRAFPKPGAAGLQDWHLRVTGAADADLPFRVVLLPRDGSLAWTADLDGDGSPEWVLESPAVRAVFSSKDGRWREFLWKDTGANFLPLEGALAAPGPVTIRAGNSSLQVAATDFTRTITLAGDTLTVESSGPLPPDSLLPQTVGNLRFSIDRDSPNRAVYRIRQNVR